MCLRGSSESSSLAVVEPYSTNVRLNCSSCITSNMSKLVTFSMFYCELTLVAATTDKVTGAHSFQMKTGRRGATETGVTAGGEISAIRQQEKVEQTSILNEQR